MTHSDNAKPRGWQVSGMRRTSASWLRISVWLILTASIVPLTTGVARAQSNNTLCSDIVKASGWQAPRVRDAAGDISFERFIDALLEKNVIVVGERHDRYDHHLTQLEIICRLGRAQRPLVISFEQFQRSKQATLDTFLASPVDHDRLLEASEYYSLWGYDYRLYKPILDHAHAMGHTLIAANADSADVVSVRENGLQAMQDDPRFGYVSAHRDEGYRQRLLRLFNMMGGEHGGRSPKRMVDVQTLWDESMAEAIVRSLNLKETSLNSPRVRAVALAGNGHAGFDDAIAARVRARGVTGVTTVAQLDVREFDADEVDSIDAVDAEYRLYSQVLSLPDSGRVGIHLEPTTDASGVMVVKVAADGAGARAGVSMGERIVQIDGLTVATLDDLRRALWRKRPNETVSLDSVDSNGKRQTRRVILD